LVLIAGLYFPIPAAALGLGIIIGRILYSIGYVTKGPQGRRIGVIINDLAFLGAFVLAFISSIYFILGNDL
jgi:glutathione S-transferase